MVRPVLLLCLSAFLGCATLPSSPVKPPDLPTDKQTRCSVLKSQANPLIVEWPGADRATLEARARKAVVPVRYVGCEMEILKQCALPGQYAYTALNKQRESIVVRDVDELYAKLPLGAASLEGALKSAGELNVAMVMVGRYEWSGTPRYGDLQGPDCSKATHVVSALIVGAFDFFAGTDSEKGGGIGVAGVETGIRKQSKRTTIDEAGDEAACARSTTKDSEPPNDCGAMLRVEVIPIPDAPAFTEEKRAEATPAAPPPVSTSAPAASPPVSTSAPATPASQRLVSKGGVLRDSQTGLLWAKEIRSGLSYDKAEEYCSELRLSEAPLRNRSNLLAQELAEPRGNGWRIPSANELMTLKGLDSSMRGAFWTSDESSARRTRVDGNLLAQVYFPPRTTIEFPLGVSHKGTSPYDKRNVRCVK